MTEPTETRSPLQTLDPDHYPKIDRINRTTLSGKRVFKAEWRDHDFVDLNGRGSEFEGCDFRYAIFERAYLRDATFRNCRFDGARFIDCNMRGARFIQCEVQYTTFSRCLLDPSEIISVLPLRPNVRRELLRNLKANAIEIGDFANIKLIVLAELEATKLHYRHAALGYDSYYKQKYALFNQRLQAGFQYAGLKIDQWVWGHGERPWQLLLSAGFIIVALALLNFWSVLDRVPWGDTAGGLRILTYVLRTLLDMPVDMRFSGFVFVDYMLVIMRYVYIGLFVSVLYKAISHR